MANFSPHGSLTFPAPSTAGKPVVSNTSTPVSFNQSTLYSSAGSGIQFPSPVYVSSTPTLRTTSYTVARTNINPARSLGVEMDGLRNESLVNRVTNGWHHSTPSTMPWAPSEPFNSTLIQFNAASTPPRPSVLEKMQPIENLHIRRLKRRAETSNSELGVGSESKVFINEDRVAEGMRNLQLGNTANNNMSSASDRNQAWYSCTRAARHSLAALQNTETGEMEDEPVCTSSPRIKLSKELKAGFHKKDLVQQLIMQEMSKSCKQLVLWRPPGDQIKQLLSGMGEVSRSTSQLSRTMDVIDMGVATSHVTSDTTASLRENLRRDSLDTSAMDGVQSCSQSNGEFSCQSSVGTSFMPANRNGINTSRSSQALGSPSNRRVLQASPNNCGNNEDLPAYLTNNNNVQTAHTPVAFPNQLTFQSAQHSTSLGSLLPGSNSLGNLEQTENSTLDFMEEDSLEL